MTFYYCRGQAETHKPWQRPSPNRIQAFLNKAIPVIENLGLELWLTGKALRDPENTWDLDCYLIGQIDPELNQDLQHALIQAGFDQDMLVDPYWASNHSPAYKQDNLWFQQPSRIFLLYPVIWRNNGRENIIDHRNNPNIPQITENLVEFAYGQQPLKPKHVEYLNLQGDFQRIKAQDYAEYSQIKNSLLNMA